MRIEATRQTVATLVLNAQVLAGFRQGMRLHATHDS